MDTADISADSTLTSDTPTENQAPRDIVASEETASAFNIPNSGENVNSEFNGGVFNANPGAGVDNGRQRVSQFWENTLRRTEEAAGTPMALQSHDLTCTAAQVKASFLTKK